ncbi:hypothetical protein ACOMHN_052408 [Nucella lapillus]
MGAHQRKNIRLRVLMMIEMDSNEVFTFSVGVVLPAAGCGERMKLETPKQFCEVNGRPLICYTIDSFHRAAWIQQIVISTSAAHLELLKELTVRYGFDKVTLVEGGTTRHRSIHAGVKALQQVDPSIEVVVIHDAVRPFVSADLLRNIAVAAHEHGAAGVCRPLVSTVIARDSDQRLRESLDRSQYFNSEMPQAFQVPVIAKAYSKCSSDDLDFGTECLLLALKHSGVQARILDGDPDLWKVTYKKDLFAAEVVLKERLTRVSLVHGDCWSELAAAVTSRLTAQHMQVVKQVKPEEGAGEAASPACSMAANTLVLLHPLHPLSTRPDSPRHGTTTSTATTLSTRPDSPRHGTITSTATTLSTRPDSPRHGTNTSTATTTTNDSSSSLQGMSGGLAGSLDSTTEDKCSSVSNRENIDGNIEGTTISNDENMDGNVQHTTIYNNENNDGNVQHTTVSNRENMDGSMVNGLTHSMEYPTSMVNGLTHSMEYPTSMVNGLTHSMEYPTSMVNGLTHSMEYPTVLAGLRRVQSEHNSLLRSCQSQLVDFTFLHLFVASDLNEGMKMQADLSRALLQLSKELGEKGVLVLGVLASKEAAVHRVSEMVTSLIQRGHRAFSGQLFLVA